LGAISVVHGIVNVPLGIEPYTMGKELEAAKTVLDRMEKRFRSGFVDIILSDAIYLNTNHITLVVKKD